MCSRCVVDGVGGKLVTRRGWKGQSISGPEAPNTLHLTLLLANLMNAPGKLGVLLDRAVDCTVRCGPR